MAGFVLVVIVIFLIVGYFQNKQKNAPHDLIDQNILRAETWKKTLKENLKKDIADTFKMLEKVAKEEGIKTNIDVSNSDNYKKSLAKRKNELQKNNQTKNMYNNLQFKYKIRDEEIYYLETLYLKAEEKFKFEPIELAKISVDYADWFMWASKFFDPNNDLIESDSFNNQREAGIKTEEIKKRLIKKIENN